jgi:hypothetical protein
MQNMLLILACTALVTAVLNALSLLAAAESLRALGRIAGGLSWLAAGTLLLNLPPVAAALGSVACVGGWVLLLCGILAVGSGVRKYGRRNLS